MLSQVNYPLLWSYFRLVKYYDLFNGSSLMARTPKTWHAVNFRWDSLGHAMIGAPKAHQMQPKKMNQLGEYTTQLKLFSFCSVLKTSHDQCITHYAANNHQWLIYHHQSWLRYWVYPQKTRWQLAFGSQSRPLGCFFIYWMKPGTQ